MKRGFVLIGILFITIHNLTAQSQFVGGIFPTIDHSGKLTKKLDYSLYYFGAFPLVNFNKPNISKDADFLLFYSEQALTYNWNKRLSFTGSYVYQRENVLRDNFINEHRFYVQASYKQFLNRHTLKHRVRFDNRFVENRITETYPYTHRLRYLVGIDMPIRSKKNNLYFTAYEEAFFNTFKDASARFAENWAYAAIGFKLNKRHKIETGPLYITWNTGPKSWFHQAYLQVTWLSTANFLKSKKKN